MTKTAAANKSTAQRRLPREASVANTDSIVVPMSLRAELKRVTRDRLISAAEELFQEQGFRVTSVEQIVRAAGTTTTTFYRHFKSKHDLAVLVQDRLAKEVLAVLKKLDAIRRPSRTQIRAWVDEYFAMWQQNHVLCDAFWEATTTDPSLARDILPVTFQMTSTLNSFLARFSKNLKRRAQLRLSLFVLLLDRVAYLAETLQSKPDAKELLDEYADILWVSLYELKE